MDIVRKNIQSLTPYAAGKSAEEVREKYNLEKIIKLGSNENPHGTSPKAIEAMKAAVNDLSIYPDSSSRKLIRALAALYGIQEDEIIPGNGSDEIFLMIAAAFLNPGEEALISDNTFSQYRCVSRIFNGKVRSLPLKNFSYDLDAFTKSVGADTKLLFLCNPNNPTGKYFTHNEVQDLLKSVPENCIVVLDEAYAEWADAPDFPDFVSLLKVFDRLIVCRTFSKIYGLAGIRLGYAMAHPEIIDQLKKVKNFNPFNVNSIAQAGACAALADRKFFRLSRDANIEGRNYIESEFKKYAIEFLPSQANFICFNLNRPSPELAEAMARRGVIIRPLRSFGMETWCRVTVGTKEQNEVFLKTLWEVLGI